MLVGLPGEHGWGVSEPCCLSSSLAGGTLLWDHFQEDLSSWGKYKMERRTPGVSNWSFFYRGSFRLRKHRQKMLRDSTGGFVLSTAKTSVSQNISVALPSHPTHMVKMSNHMLRGALVVHPVWRKLSRWQVYLHGTVTAAGRDLSEAGPGIAAYTLRDVLSAK